MTRSLLLFVVATSSLISATAFGEVIDRPADIVKAVQAGRQGAWLDTSALRRCLDADVVRESLEKQVKTLDETKLTLLSSLSSCKLVIDDSGRESQILREEGLAKDKLISGLTADLSAWYRNPLVMVAGGLVLGVIATTAVIVAAH